MKKYYYLLVAMMMAVMTAGLTACGNSMPEYISCSFSSGLARMAKA